MTFPLDEKRFIEMWQPATGNTDNADNAFRTLGKATVRAINQAYYAGMKAGSVWGIEAWVPAGLRLAPLHPAEVYRNAISDLIGSSDGLEYLQAVYSFAEAYPHKVTKEKDVPLGEKRIKEIVDILREAGLKTQTEIYYFVREYCGQDCGENRVELADADGEKLELICRLSKKLMK